MSSGPPGSDAPRTLFLGGGVEAVFHLLSETSDGRVTIVEHPMAPGSLIEPHTHQREDEYSFVTSGTLGMLLGDEEFEAAAGAFVAKPRGVRHAAWNAGPEPARFLEVISPGGFEHFFFEVADLFSGPADPSAEELQRLSYGYGLSFHIDMVNDLVERHGLTAAVRY